MSEEAPAAGIKGAKQKKGKAGKASKTGMQEDDIDALLAQLDGPKADATKPLQLISGVHSQLALACRFFSISSEICTSSSSHTQHELACIEQECTRRQSIMAAQR